MKSSELFLILKNLLDKGYDLDVCVGGYETPAKSVEVFTEAVYEGDDDTPAVVVLS